MSYAPYPRPVSGEVFTEEFMKGLDRKMKLRDDYSSLVNKNYVQKGVSSKVSAAKVMLKRGLLEDKISDFLHSRPDADELLKHHILEEGYGSGVSPAIMKAQKEYEAARRKDLLHRNIERRSDRDELIRKNILKDVYMAESQRAATDALKRSMLEDKLNKAFGTKKRPSRETLVKRGIVEEDVYDKIISLEGEEARELLLRMALRGGLWANQIELELNDLVGDFIEVDKSKLERKLSTRPSREKLRQTNILKMRGSEVNTKFLATRVLSKNLASRPEREELERANIVHGEERETYHRKSNVLEEALSEREDMEELRKRGILI